VCIQEYLAGSSITASAVISITLDQRHATTDQIKAVSHKSRGKINSRATCARDFRMSHHCLVVNRQSLNFLLLFLGREKREKPL